MVRGKVRRTRKYKPRPAVKVTPHAVAQWHDRVGPLAAEKIEAIIRRRLINELAVGLAASDKEAAHLPICPGLRAVVRADEWGGWVVLTVLTTRPPGSIYPR